jgi:hypothetical protein
MQIGEESGSAMNPGSCMNEEMVEFVSIDAVMNDSLQIVSSRLTITVEEVQWCKSHILRQISYVYRAC